MPDTLTRRPRRLPSGVLGAALAVAALAACSSDGPSTSTASPSSPTSPVATTTGDAPTSTSDAPGATSATSSTTAASGGTAAGQAVDVCSLLTDAEVNAAGSEPFTEKKPATAPQPGESTCYWNAKNRTVVAVEVITDPAQAKKTYEEGRSGLFFNDKTPGPAIGTGAYWRLAGPRSGPMLRFMQGDRLVSISNDNPKRGGLSSADEAGLRTKVEALGRAVSAKLG